MTALEGAKRELVTANRILAHEGVVDAFGHVSMRHPERPDRFILSFSRSPELVEPDDLGIYDLSGNLVTESDRRPYAERFIHAAIYEARSDVQAVIHNHSHDVLPFAVTGERLRPICHTGAVMGEHVATWDIREKFGDTNMLVVNMEQARDLAETLGKGTAVLMRGHGCTVVGISIRRAVISAIYMMVNARLQLAARQLGAPVFLSPEETRRASEMNLSALAVDRLWEYWSRRALS